METRSNAQRFFGRWALATFGGWVLGFVVIVLLAGIGDLVHIGGDQWAVGVGMGWSIGCAQWWVARKWFGPSSKWMWASVVGMGTPFVLSDLVGVWGHAPEFLIGPNAAVGGLLVGLWQRRMLRSHSARANWWVPACIAGWMLAAALPPALIGSRPGPHWSNLVGIALGGVVLGAVTGSALVWVLRSWLLQPKNRLQPPPAKKAAAAGP